MTEVKKKKRTLPKTFKRKRPDEILTEINQTLADYEEFLRVSHSM